jgi:hypothetical protein
MLYLYLFPFLTTKFPRPLKFYYSYLNKNRYSINFIINLFFTLKLQKWLISVHINAELTNAISFIYKNIISTIYINKKSLKYLVRHRLTK